MTVPYHQRYAVFQFSGIKVKNNTQFSEASGKKKKKKKFSKREKRAVELNKQGIKFI